MKAQKKQPELRFKGFTDDWELRKLGEVYNFQYGQFNNNPDNGGQYPIYGANGIIGGYDEYNSENAIVIGHMGAYAGHVLWAEGKHFVTYNGTMGIADKSILNSNFGYYLVVSVNVPKLTAGSGQPFVSYSDLNGIKILIPTIEEQQKIGSFFKQLDNTIALHQRKLDLLKEQKKGYLQKMFPKNGAKVPELRFAGFADAWEQRKLGEIAIRVRGNDGRMNLPTLTISAGNGWMDQRDRFSQNIAGKEQKNYTLLRQGELSYNHGNSKLAQFGAVFELESYNEALVPRVYHSFSVTAGAQPKFIEQMFATHRPDRELRKLVSSGARMDGLLNINYDDFMGIKVWLPSVAEQQAISGLLVKLDNTIALHQRKLELLKEQKKGFLQKMFV